MAKASVINFESKRAIKVSPGCQNRKSIPLYTLPFKIRITNVTVPGYTPINVPPIGLAIIGINNYIL